MQGGSALAEIQAQFKKHSGARWEWKTCYKLHYSSAQWLKVFGGCKLVKTYEVQAKKWRKTEIELDNYTMSSNVGLKAKKNHRGTGSEKTYDGWKQSFQVTMVRYCESILSHVWYNVKIILKNVFHCSSARLTLIHVSTKEKTIVQTDVPNVKSISSAQCWNKKQALSRFSFLYTKLTIKNSEHLYQK